MSGERGGLGPHERRLSGVVASPGLDPAASGEGLAHLFACLRRAVDLLDDCGFDIDARVVEAHAAQLARGEEWPGDPIPDRWPVDRLPSPGVSPMASDPHADHMRDAVKRPVGDVRVGDTIRSGSALHACPRCGVPWGPHGRRCRGAATTELPGTDASSAVPARANRGDAADA